MNKQIDISNVVLKTDRLVLRPFSPMDLDDFYAYASVPGVGERAGWPHHQSIKDSLKILNDFISQKKTFAIVFNDKVIGSLGIEFYYEAEFPEFTYLFGREIGYVIGKEYWNQGLMSEAVKAVVDYLFNVVKLDFIVCSHYVENTASQKVMEKNGFRHYKLIKTTNIMKETKDAWVSLLFYK